MCSHKRYQSSITDRRFCPSADILEKHDLYKCGGRVGHSLNVSFCLSPQCPSDNNLHKYNIKLELIDTFHDLYDTLQRGEITWNF